MMPKTDCYGRECKLGWGYNKSLNHLIPVQEKPPTVTTRAWDLKGYNVSNVMSTEIENWVLLYYRINSL